MPFPRDYLERTPPTDSALPEPSRIWHAGNTTGTVPTQHPTGPYITWHGALVPDWRELVRRLEARE